MQAGSSRCANKFRGIRAKRKQHDCRDQRRRDGFYHLCLNSDQTPRIHAPCNVLGAPSSGHRLSGKLCQALLLYSVWGKKFTFSPLSKGRPFLDRNPKMFEYILEYLRTDIYPTKQLSDAQGLPFECEMDYFNLERPVSSLPIDRLFCRKSIKVDSDERMLILCFDVFGDILIIGNRDGTIHLWSIEEGKKLGQLVGHNAAVSDVRIAPNISGRMIVISCSNDQRIRIWDLWSHQTIRVIEGNGSFNAIDLLEYENRNLICAAGRTCCVFAVDNGELLSSWSSD